MNYDIIWDQFLANINQKLNNEFIFNTWFFGTDLISLDENSAKVSVPTPVHVKFLNEVYLNLIQESFKEVTSTSSTFDFICVDTNDILPEGKPVFDRSLSNLNQKYTFETFVVGKSNQFAHKCAVAIAQKPGTMYNPFFIFGKSGLGKTHLIQAIGNYIVENNNERVLYVSSQQFLEEFVESLKSDNTEIFKSKYRNVDVLIIDDIQFLTNADKTQEEFFHTFNILHQANKQIIISSDRSTDDLKKLESRLRTRFNWGISTDIEPPEFELRIEILKRKIIAEKIDIEISDEVITYIANKVDSDVRELEGTLRLLLANATLLSGGRDIDIEFAKSILSSSKNFKPTSKNKVESIINEICSIYNVSVNEIKGTSRKVEINFPRQLAMFLIRDLTDYSYVKIGEEFGSRHHTTVMNSCQKIQKQINSDEKLRSLVQKIVDNVN